MEGWKIQRDRTPCCDAFGKARQPGQEYFAVLELPQCVRRDLCPTCFHKLDRRAGDGAETPVFWKCRRKLRTDQGPVLDLVALRMLFDRLGGVEDERAQGLRYFVSLLLLRKRVLRMVDAQNEEQERADLVVVDPKVPDMAPAALVAPALDEERLANLETELIEALSDADAGDEDAASEVDLGSDPAAATKSPAEGSGESPS